jgi:anti-sigma B factor antagonist
VAEVTEAPDLASSTEIVAGVPVVTAPAAIDISNGSLLRAILLRASAGGHPTVVLDLRATDFCDSAGLSVLVRAHRRALAEGGELRLVVTTPQVARILEVTGLDRWLPCYASLTEAVAPGPLPRSAEPRAGLATA